MKHLFAARGIAITGMHYTGIAATAFRVGAICGAAAGITR